MQRGVPPRLLLFHLMKCKLPIAFADCGCVLQKDSPSSPSNAGVDRDTSEQLLLPLCPGFRRTATPQPSRNEECHFPGLLGSVARTHICISSQLVSTRLVLFACLALEVAPRTCCSPLLSPRRKVEYPDPKVLLNANWQVARVTGEQ